MPTRILMPTRGLCRKLSLSVSQKDRNISEIEADVEMFAAPCRSRDATHPEYSSRGRRRRHPLSVLAQGSMNQYFCFKHVNFKSARHDLVLIFEISISFPCRATLDIPCYPKNKFRSAYAGLDEALTIMNPSRPRRRSKSPSKMRHFEAKWKSNIRHVPCPVSWV